MFARLKGIELDSAPAPGGLGSDEYKVINPTGKIPSLEHDGQLIAECEVICEYLEDLGLGNPAMPSDPLERAQSRIISRVTDLYVAPHNTPLRPHRDPANRDQTVVDAVANEFAKAFVYVEHFMGKGPFAAGSTPSIGDCALAPFIGMLQQTVFPYFEEIPDPTVSSPRIKDWWQALQTHPECKASVDEYEQELEAFLKRLAKLMAERNK